MWQLENDSDRFQTVRLGLFNWAVLVGTGAYPVFRSWSEYECRCVQAALTTAWLDGLFVMHKRHKNAGDEGTKFCTIPAFSNVKLEHVLDLLQEALNSSSDLSPEWLIKDAIAIIKGILK